MTKIGILHFSLAPPPLPKYEKQSREGTLSIIFFLQNQQYRKCRFKGYTDHFTTRGMKNCVYYILRIPDFEYNSSPTHAHVKVPSKDQVPNQHKENLCR